MTAQQEASLAANTIVSAGITLVVTVLAVTVLTGILTVVVSRAVLGENLSAAVAWRRARPRVGALLGVTALTALIVTAAALLPVAPGLLGLLSGAPGAVVAPLLVLGVLAGLVLGAWLYVLLVLAPAAVVLERQPVLAALRRSRALVAGAWWRTFGLILLVNVIAQVLAGILGLPFTAVGFGLAFVSFDGNPYALVPLVLTSLGTIVGATITWPFVAAATALIYVDRRIRREGLDLELARAAGVTLPSVMPAPNRAFAPAHHVPGGSPGYGSPGAAPAPGSPGGPPPSGSPGGPQPTGSPGRPAGERGPGSGGEADRPAQERPGSLGSPPASSLGAPPPSSLSAPPDADEP